MKKEINIEKLKSKFFITKIMLVILYIFVVGVFIFLDRDIFTIFFPNIDFKGIDFFLFVFLIFMSTILYFMSLFLMQKQISKILIKQCDPEAYMKVYMRVNKGKMYEFGNKIVDLNANFLLGNFEVAKVKAFDVLQSEKNPSIRNIAYNIIIQIYALTEDLNSINSVRRGILNEITVAKNPLTYQGVLNVCNIFIDYLNGNYNGITKSYDRLKDQHINKCEYYLNAYYYALSLLKSNEHEKAIPLFQEIIMNANKLFVVRYSKVALIRMAV